MNATVIIGAGPAGTRAAEILCGAGIRPVVIDEGARAGGQIYRRQPDDFQRSPKALYGFEAGRATAIHSSFDALLERIDYRANTLAWSIDGGKVHLYRGETGQVEHLPFSELILATGATDRVIPFEGWTLPGVYTLGGSQVSLKAQACGIGREVVFMGTGPLLYLVSYQYMKAGAIVRAVLDTTPFATTALASWKLAASPALLAKGLYYRARLQAAGVDLRSGVVPLAALGSEGVEAFRFKDAQGQSHELPCDAVAFGYHVRPEAQLADTAGCRFEFEADLREWRPVADPDGRSSVPGIFLAGDGAGVLGADAAEASGRLAAWAVLRDRGMPVRDAAVTKSRAEKARGLSRAKALRRMFPVPFHLVPAVADETVLCRCECISAGEFRDAVRRLDLTEVNRAKALTRISMGRCQGRFCGMAATQMLANVQNLDLPAAGRLRIRAPIKPLPIEAALPEAAE